MDYPSMKGAGVRGAALCLLSVACAPGSGSDGAGETDGTTSSSSADAADESGVGPVPTGQCISAAVGHAAQCPDEACPITVDVEITCGDGELGAPGTRVAPAPGVTYMVSSGSSDWYLFDVQPEGASRILDVPGDMLRKTISLALDPDGNPHLAVDETRYMQGTYAGALSWVGRVDGQWVHEEVFDNDRYIEPLSFEVGPDGAPRVWFEDDPPDSMELGVREADGSWTLSDAVPAASGGWHRFTVDADGSPVAFDFDDGGSGWQLRMRRAGMVSSVGTPVEATFPHGYRVSSPPMPPGVADGPALAVVVQHDDALRIAWPDGELELPQSPLWIGTCDEAAADPENCPESCEELGVGIDVGIMAIARTEDGVAWIAYVVRHADMTLTYEEYCGEGLCECRSRAARDDSTYVLHLVRAQLDAEQVDETFALSVDPPAWETLFSGDDDVRVLDLQGFGTDLALGVRVREDDAFKWRVLRIDTTSTG